jgi:predicted metalloprotease with PDZ domain
MIRILLTLLFLGQAAPLVAQSLEYQVDLTDSRSKRVKVVLTPKKLGAKKVYFQMPAWAPGAYSVTNYGRFVKDFQAYDAKGKQLATNQLDQNRWEISDAKSIGRIEYYVVDSRKDSTSLWFAMAHIDTNLFFANATALFGYVNDKKNVPATVTYNKPANWELATSLDLKDGKAKRDCSFTQTVFKAANYDELADAPILAAPELQTRCFDQDGALYEVVMVSNREFQMDSLADATKKIVKAQTDFFHEVPYKHYTFLYYSPTFMQMPSMGMGALEHANASAYLMMYQPWSQYKDGGLRIISHEFFHLWNVKRIHSTLLGPFDYTKGVRTSSLWLAEGVTDYYAHSLLARVGLTTPEKFLGDLREWYGNYRNSRPARTKSLEELSREESDFIMENAIVLYTKGPLVGLMLDLEIRNRTNNQKSLDDVMLALNNDAKKGKHFKDEELIAKVGKIVGVDLSDFYQRYIAGADSIAIEAVLNRMGLTSKFDLTSEMSGDDGKMRMNLSQSGQMVIDELPSSSFFAQAGFLKGDTVVSLNGTPVSVDNITELMQNVNRDADQVVIVRRAGEEQSIRFRPSLLEQRRSGNKSRPVPYKLMTDQTPLQAAIREAIMGKMN